MAGADPKKLEKNQRITLDSAIWLSLVADFNAAAKNVDLPTIQAENKAFFETYFPTFKKDITVEGTIGEIETTNAADAVRQATSRVIAKMLDNPDVQKLKFDMGAKDAAMGRLDCSGAIAFFNKALHEITGGKVTYTNDGETFEVSLNTDLLKKLNNCAAEQIKVIAESTEGMIANPTVDNLREGMFLGSTGQSHAASRFGGVGHITMTAHLPGHDELMVVHMSSSEKEGEVEVRRDGLPGRGGIKVEKASDWLARQKNTVYAVDWAKASVANEKKLSLDATADATVEHNAPAAASAAPRLA